MLYVNFLEPHRPYFGPLDNEYDPAHVDLPANFDNLPDDDAPARYRRKQKADSRPYPTVEAWRSLIARYWGLVTEVDRSVGEILNTLETLGLADNTIVVYSSDHGDMMGAHRMIEKSVMYQEAVRVPWLMRIPQMAAAQRIIPDPVSHIDMVPTLMELLRAAPRPKLPGQSLVSLISGGKLAQDHVFIEWNSSRAAKPKKKAAKPASTDEKSGEESREESTRAVISPDGWKLCRSDIAQSQLFCLREDPGETKNVLALPQHRDIVRRLSERIHRWQEAVGDKLVVSEH
jgi:arylsulfatase A-like enzyme